jgi:hypothetical protein
MILRRLLVGGRCACLVLALSPAAAEAATHGHARRQTGTLRVVVSGLPRGVRADVVVIGPHARRFVLTRSTLLSSLGPGPYRVQVNQIALQHAARGLPAGSVIEPQTASVTGTVGAGRITNLVAGYGTIRSGIVHALAKRPLAVLGSDPSVATGIVLAGRAPYTPGMIVTAAPSATLPGGLLDTVTAVKSSGGATILTLTPATLAAAFPRLDINETAPLFAAHTQASSSQAHGADATNQSVAVDFSAGAGADGAFAANCGFSAGSSQGAFVFDPALGGTVSVATDISYSSVAGFAASSSGGLRVLAHVAGSLAVAIPRGVSCQATIPGAHLQGSITVGGVPVPVFATVYLNVSAATTTPLSEQASVDVAVDGGAASNGALSLAPTGNQGALTAQSLSPFGGWIDVTPTIDAGIGVGAGTERVAVAAQLELTGTLDPATCNLDLNAALADGPIRGPINADNGKTFTIAGPGGPLPPLYSCATDSGPTEPNGPAGPAGPTEPAGPGSILAPALGSPTISGSAQRGQTLTATPGTLAGGAASATAYQWQRDASGSWSDIPGATSITYSPTSSDAGDSLRVVETATNSAGSSTTSSAPTAAVPTADQQAEAVAIEAAHDADTWGASNGGSYIGLSLGGLRTIDAAIPVGPPTPGPYIAAPPGLLGEANGYTVTAVSVNGDAFSVIRIPSSPSLIYTCTSMGGSVNGCPASGAWTPPGS